MGCQPTKCKICQANVPACQLSNGLCGACKSNQSKLAVPQPKLTNPNQVKTY